MGLFSKKKDSKELNIQPSKVPDFNTLLTAPPGPPPSLDSVDNPFAQPGQMSPLLPPEPKSFDFQKQDTPFVAPTAVPDFQRPGFSTVQSMPVPAPMTPPQRSPGQVPSPPRNSQSQQTGDDENEVNDEEFDLPDFDDDEIKRLEAREEEGERETAQAAEKKQLPDWSSEAGEEEDWHEAPAAMPAPLPAKQITQEMPTPMRFEPRIIKEPPVNRTELYLELSDFFRLKENLTGAKNLARDTEEDTRKQAYKARLDKYNAVSSAVNAIQDRLMLIDGKLFGKSEVNNS